MPIYSPMKFVLDGSEEVLAQGRTRIIGDARRIDFGDFAIEILLRRSDLTNALDEFIK